MLIYKFSDVAIKQALYYTVCTRLVNNVYEVNVLITYGKEFIE